MDTSNESTHSVSTFATVKSKASSLKNKLFKPKPNNGSEKINKITTATYLSLKS